MIGELLYTSAPWGVRPFSSGYCTVAHTRGMAPQLIEALEGLSRFDLPARVQDESTFSVAWRYQHLRLRNQTYYVLTRIGANGIDFSGRARFLAHHIILTAASRRLASPASLMRVPGLFCDQFGDEPQLLEPRVLPSHLTPSGLITAFDDTIGHPLVPHWDQLWADRSAEVCVRKRKPLFIIHPDSIDTLLLLAAAESRQGQSHCWQATFCTPSALQGQHDTFNWRLTPSTSPYAREVLRDTPGEQVLDLTGPLSQSDVRSLAPISTDEIRTHNTGERS